jgi:predicted ATPase/DNA-binding CsgD family transcriptional regulator
MDGYDVGSAGPPTDATRFFGRRAELAMLRGLLARARAITVTGPGGVGKTRLANQLLYSAEEQAKDRVVFVGLADVHDEALLPQVVADQLGLRDQSGREPTEAIVDFLCDRAVRLVLDNCEHLVDACASLVHALLRACPAVSVLSTSRQSLGIPGEQVLPLLPLPIGEDTLELLVDRATAVLPTFRRTTDNEADLIRICERVEGLPLAIELAAARLRSLSPGQVADRLAEGLSLLVSKDRTAPERHQTLRATIDWSYGLCSAEERTVWARASVFAGGFDLEAAEHVCGDPEIPTPVLDVIENLLDKSVLVREEAGDQVRYRFLEELRAYGRQLLAESGRLDEVSRLHRDWFDRLTSEADEGWASAAQIEWVRRLRADHSNLRAALAWSLATDGEAVVALRMASRLDEYWSMVRGLNAEAQLWIDRALDRTPSTHPDRALALAVSAVYSLWQTKLDDADRRLAEARTLADKTGDAVLHARIDHITAFSMMLRVTTGTAALAAEAAAVFAAHGMPRREIHPLFIVAVGRAYRGEHDAADRAVRRGLLLTEQMDDVQLRGTAWYAAALVGVIAGDVDAAARATREALLLLRRLHGPHGLAYLLDCAAWIASELGSHTHAATLFGAAAGAWEALGSRPEVALGFFHRDHLAATQAALGETLFRTAYDAGRGHSRDDAIDLALAAGEPPKVPDVLTKREAEIARLVAEGLTNREIAARLVISQRTADTHMQNILTKLGLHKRAQVAAWIVSSAGIRLPERQAASRHA